MSTNQTRNNLTRAELARAAKLGFPIIRTIDGEARFIDAVGVVYRGRYYPLSKKPDAEQVELARQWLGRVSRIKTPGSGSYYLKHVAERWAGHYITNGAFLLAAHRCEFRLAAGPQDTNASVGVSLRSLNRLPEVQS